MVPEIENVPPPLPQLTVSGRGVVASAGDVTNERSEAMSAVTIARFFKRKREIVLILITLRVSG
jgi:hypothetical protein